MRKPFFRKARQAWYVWHKGRICRLSEDEAEAHRVWQAMISIRSQSLERQSSAVVLARYGDEGLTGGDAYRAKVTRYLIEAGRDLQSIPAGDLSSRDVLDWLDRRTTWGVSVRRDAIVAIKSAWRWAHDEGLLPRNRLASLKAPEGRRREGLITTEQHATMCMAKDGRLGERGTHDRAGAFRAVMIALRHTGARPRTISQVEARHVSHDGAAWVLPEHKTRGKTKKPLVVYLTLCAQTLTRILAAARPVGPLFLNDAGRRWTKDGIARRMGRLRKKLGLPAGVVAYSSRHTFATNALIRGLGIATVAELLGHSDATMVARVYGHLDKANDYLKDAARMLFTSAATGKDGEARAEGG